MHWSRYMTRGYDHIYLLSKILSKHTKIPTNSLLKTKFGYHQSRLAKRERIKNRENAFFLKEGKTLPEVVILLDDVIST